MTNDKLLVDLFEISEASSVFNLYIHAQLALREQIRKYKDTSEVCHTDDSFELAIRSYAKARNISISKACKLLYATTESTAQEQMLSLLKKTMSMYGINQATLEKLLGYSPSDLRRIMLGERPVYKELLLAFFMFLEFDLNIISSNLRSCGLTLCHCFPDWIYINHINAGDYSVSSYVNDVFKYMRQMNLKRIKDGCPQIKLPAFYRADRFYPSVSISAFKVYDGYDFSSENITKVLY